MDSAAANGSMGPVQPESTGTEQQAIACRTRVAMVWAAHRQDMVELYGPTHKPLLKFAAPKPNYRARFLFMQPVGLGGRHHHHFSKGRRDHGPSTAPTLA